MGVNHKYLQIYEEYTVESGRFFNESENLTISFLIKALSGLPIAINFIAIIATLTESTSVGLFFGIYPASQAAKLNPVEALHYE